MSARAWFDLARAGNFPSVASNVLAALVLSSTEQLMWPGGIHLAGAVLAGCLVYAGGATFNDVFDADFDRRHRPERPIPQGIVSRAAAGWVAAAEMLAGLGLLVLMRGSLAWTAGLAVVVLLYDWVHKRWVGSVVLMAGCRVLLAFAVASLPGHAASPGLLWWVGVLFLYIATLSLIARTEYKPGAAKASVGRAVGGLLAFIPLVDAIALLLFGAWLPALACAAAVPFGRVAQRLAAST